MGVSAGAVRWHFLPNALTLTRILLVVPIVWALSREDHRTALALLLVAALTDALDGQLARRYQWSTALGAVLDPIADKLLLTALYIVLAWIDHLPVWLAGLVVARDLVIVGGAASYYLLFGAFRMRPSPAGKVNTAVQLTLLGYVLARLAGVPLPESLVAPLVWLTAASTVASGADYVYTWAWRAIVRRQGQ